jgi:hypothetical protein
MEKVYHGAMYRFWLFISFTTVIIMIPFLITGILGEVLTNIASRIFDVAHKIQQKLIDNIAYHKNKGN